MPANIVRYHYPSPAACLLSAAAVAMSSFLPAWQQDGRWVGQLEPGQVVRDYERRYGPVPAYGADPGDVWILCQDYGFEAHYPDGPHGWDLDRAARIVDAGIPLVVSYWRAWDYEGNPLSAHAGTVFALDPAERVALWDADYGRRDLVWSIEDLYWQWVWRDGWIAYPKYTGWIVALVPRGHGLPG